MNASKQNWAAFRFDTDTDTQYSNTAPEWVKEERKKYSLAQQITSTSLKCVRALLTSQLHSLYDFVRMRTYELYAIHSFLQFSFYCFSLFSRKFCRISCWFSLYRNSVDNALNFVSFHLSAYFFFRGFSFMNLWCE